MWHLILIVLKKVLIVEDDNDLVKLLKYNLEKEAFRVNYATDGALALAEARRDPPGLVILDLMLPGLDGLEVCRQLRRIDRFARTPVLILAARNEEVDRVVDLSALEFKLLHYMALHPGIVFSREQLLDSMWGNDRTVTPRSVDVYIRRIREKVDRSLSIRHSFKRCMASVIASPKRSYE